jgi:hypothetical protein
MGEKEFKTPLAVGISPVSRDPTHATGMRPTARGLLKKAGQECPAYRCSMVWWGGHSCPPFRTGHERLFQHAPRRGAPERMRIALDMIYKISVNSVESITSSGSHHQALSPVD